MESMSWKRVIPCDPNASEDPRTVFDRASKSDSLPRFVLHVIPVSTIAKMPTNRRKLKSVAFCRVATNLLRTPHCPMNYSDKRQGLKYFLARLFAFRK